MARAAGGVVRRGAVGLASSSAGLATAGGAAVAGVVIAGLAIGVAIGTALRKLFGEARAVRAEEAAVEGALVLRKARAAVEAELGRPVNQAEARKLFDAYAANLIKLGFTQDARGQWRRERTRVERFLG